MKALNETTTKLDFLARKMALQKAFTDSAFRVGTSLFRLGLIPSNVSDHLPIDIHAEINNEEHQILSWNMLSDEHLFNNFMNISGIETIHDAMHDILGDNNIYKKKHMEYHFFAELSQFLYEKKNNDQRTITIDEHVLKAFCNVDLHGTRILGRSPTDEQKKEVVLAREAFLALYSTENKIMSHEVRQSIRHALEMIYHIKDGALPWDKRLEYLKSNKKLLGNILGKELLMFQEVTKPGDLVALLNPSDEHHIKMVCHNSNPNGISKDNCVLMYDERRYELIGDPTTGDIHKKPYIFALLRDKKNNQSFIAASIHHPGGNTDCRQQYLDLVSKMRTECNDPGICYMIAGDYNHTAHQFNLISNKAEATDRLATMFYPDKGSMAGNDYGNLNHGIDGVMSNLSDEKIHVSVAEPLMTSKPADPMPYAIHFYSKDTLEYQAGPLNTKIIFDSQDSPVVSTLEVNDAERTSPVSIAW